MAGSLSPSPVGHAAVLLPRRCRLSRRRVRKLVRIGQCWIDGQGGRWIVQQVHRKDEQVALMGPYWRTHYIKFEVLGRHFRLEEEP